MANRVHDTYDVTDALTLHEVWSNHTQADDPPAGYTATDGDGTVVTQRDLTADEVAEFAADDIAQAAAHTSTGLQTQARAALAANGTYLAISSPTATQQKTQIAALTRQMDAVITLLLNVITGAR